MEFTPPNEAARLAALRAYALVDTPPEERFDRLTRLAAQFFDVPVCLVSLVDARRQWFKSAYGLGVRETPREGSFCHHTIRSGDLFVVEDARLDPRFAASPLVAGPPGLRFYAGAPLLTPEGHRLGALCLGDTRPRPFTPREAAALRDFADLVAAEFEHTRRAWRAVEHAFRLNEADDRFARLIRNGSDVLTVVAPDGITSYQSPSIERLLGYAPDELVGQPILSFIHPEDRGAVRDVRARLMQGQEQTACTFRFRAKDGRWRYLEATVSNLLHDPLVRGLVVNSRDVTERKHMDDALQRSRAEAQQLALLASRTTNGVLMLDVLGRVTWANEGFTRLTGYAAHEIRGKRPWDALPGPPEEADAVAALNDALARRAHVVVEFVNHRKGGEPYWLRVDFQPLFEADGAHSGFMAIGTEITERKQAELALRESEERYRLVTQHAGEVIFDYDITSGRVSWHGAVAETTGYEPEAFRDVAVTAWEDHVHPQDREEALATLRQAIHGTGAYETRYRFRSADGRYRYIEARGTVLSDAVGRPARMLGRMADVTARQLAQERLRASEGRYRALSGLVKTFAYAYEVHPSGATSIEWVTDTAEDVLGYPPGELVGQPWGCCVTDAHRARSMACLRRVLGGETVVDDLQMRTRAGQEIWVRSIAYPEWDRHRRRVARIYGAVQDVTAQKAAERELVEAKEQAEEMSRLKSSFLANMTHEIRTPLTAILGFSDLLLCELSGQGHEFTRLIRNSGERLLATLNAVLDLAQLESQTFKLHRSPLDVAEKARGVLDLFEAQAQAQGTVLRLEAAEEPLQANLDRAALDRILSNLVSNAVKFTKGGHVVVRLWAEAGMVVLEVADTGIGIGEAFLPHVFEEFRQESEGVARNYEGNGLGLAITKRLVEMMEGAITARSTRGVGTTFTVRLPRGEAG